MIEISTARKNKINLSDYNYRRDICNRVIISSFTPTDIAVLEEILYSPLRVSFKKIAKNLGIDEEEALLSMDKLRETELLKFEGDCIVIDKEMRKYYEAHIAKYEENFKPGMDFLQNLLRKVPIHVLPLWYAIPKSSNNIFDSLVEKFLLTPQIFQRYLLELNLCDAILDGIIEDVYQAPDYKVYSKDLMEKYNLQREDFEECLLQLEFNFVCCLGYEHQGHSWKEIVTPFREWRDYLLFLKETQPQSIEEEEAIIKKRDKEFSFVEDMSFLLSLAKKSPIDLSQIRDGIGLPQNEALSMIAEKLGGFSLEPQEKREAFQKYLLRLITKLCLIKLADVVDSKLYALDSANDWLEMRLENRAHHLYRHPLNRLISHEIPLHLWMERNIREIERSIKRVLNSGWVYFDDFLKGVIAAIGETGVISLKKQGKSWKYTLPSYSEEENILIKATILEWLFEVGVVQPGTYKGRDCFKVTAFGQHLFG